MVSLFSFAAPPEPCGYLPGRVWSLQYEIVGELSAEDYALLMVGGWRRFGFSLFRPRCPECTACQSLRIPTAGFAPNSSQRRAYRRNINDVVLTIGPPDTTEEKLQLYDRYHLYQSDARGWPLHTPKETQSYAESFVHHPFPTEEWCYYLNGELIGVGYVDALSVGLSAIYFYYDPAHRSRSLGTYNVLKVIEESQRRGLEHAYLGYYVPGCQSLEYKSNFHPHEIMTAAGTWEISPKRSH